MKYIRVFEHHSGYTEFVGSGEMELPNVSYCVNENEVHYNEVLPENKELWEWFKRAYGATVTSEDFELFRTKPMVYEIENIFDDVYYPTLYLSIAVSPCLENNQYNPEWRGLDDEGLDGYNLVFSDNNESAELEDFTGLVSGTHSWRTSRWDCGK